MSQPYFIAWRFYLILSLIAIAVLGLMGRVFDLAIIDQPFLRHQGDERVLRLVSTPGFRGMIVDRNGFPLAVSTTVYSIWMNPQEFNLPKKMVSSLSHLLDMQPNELKAIMNRKQNKNREFVYLKRGLSPEVAAKLKALNLTGIYAQEEYRRYYPEGEVMAHVVGFTNVDDVGQEGVELAYNQWLQGESGKKWVTKDRLGRVISDVKLVQEQKAGHDLTLSIDRRVQYLAYRELLAGVKEYNASSGSAVVLDVKTGEILAMVNQPSFNPNNRSGSGVATFRNRAVTDTFEPGSTIKAFTVASGLESGRFKPNSLIDTSPGVMQVGRSKREVVRDHNDNGIIDLGQILQLSSNIGVAKIVLSLPPDKLWNLLHRVGFGENTGIGFQGEQTGSLVKHSPWGAFVLATLSFGYGMSATLLQLTRAYSVLANEGMLKPVTLLRLEAPPKSERAMDAKIAKQMLVLLESVLEKGGTGEKARVPGYRVAGKTGTAFLAGEGGYQKHRYISSFVGIAPLTHPRFIVAVVMHDAHGKAHMGGDVSGPVFERIMEGTLRMYAVPPDGEIH